LGHRLSGPNPFSSAADAVTSLNVEPGGNSSSLERERQRLLGIGVQLVPRIPHDLGVLRGERVRVVGRL
jgi:hypothetical protein